LSARDTRIEVTASGADGENIVSPALDAITFSAVAPRMGPGSATDTGSLWPPAMITGVPICVIA
jgi:hypothetical protein